MIKCLHTLAILAALGLGAGLARGQALPRPAEPMDLMIPGAMPMPLGDLPPGVIVIQGQIFIAPQLVPSQPRVAVELPIVSEGFANDQEVKGPIEPLLEGLRSSEFSKREEANIAMLRLPPGRLSDVVEALARAKDPETIERLTQIAGHLFLKPRTPLKVRASVMGIWHKSGGVSLLGLKFAMNPVKLSPEDDKPTMTVQVTELQPGFPAMQSLRNGDRIVAVGGEGFSPGIAAGDSQVFRERVSHLWPGSVVQMLILRDGRVMEVGVQVAGIPTVGIAADDAIVRAVEDRQNALGTFLATLKRGDGNQAMAAPAEKPSITWRPMEGTPIPMADGAANGRD